MNRLHVVTVFNSPGAAQNARRNENIKPIQRKYLTNFAVIISYTLHWNVSFQRLQNYEYLVHERICVQLRRNLDVSRGRNCSVRWTANIWRAKRLKCTLTINILILLSRPALSSSKEEHGQIRHHQEQINPRLHTISKCSVWRKFHK